MLPLCKGSIYITNSINPSTKHCGSPVMNRQPFQLSHKDELLCSTMVNGMIYCNVLCDSKAWVGVWDCPRWRAVCSVIFCLAQTQSFCQTMVPAILISFLTLLASLVLMLLPKDTTTQFDTTTAASFFTNWRIWVSSERKVCTCPSLYKAFALVLQSNLLFTFTPRQS